MVFQCYLLWLTSFSFILWRVKDVEQGGGGVTSKESGWIVSKTDGSWNRPGNSGKREAITAFVGVGRILDSYRI